MLRELLGRICEEDDFMDALALLDDCFKDLNEKMDYFSGPPGVGLNFRPDETSSAVGVSVCHLISKTYSIN